MNQRIFKLAERFEKIYNITKESQTQPAQKLNESNVSKSMRPYYDILRRGKELVDKISILNDQTDRNTLDKLDVNVKELIKQIAGFNSQFPYSENMPNEAKTMSKRLNDLLEKAVSAEHKTDYLGSWK